MKIAVMSDSHDNVPYVKKAVEYFNANAFEYLIHAGDFVAPFAAKPLTEFKGKLYCVYGNNDGDKNRIKQVLSSIVPGPIAFTLGGQKILLVHDILTLQANETNDIEIVIHGHTHEPKIDRNEKSIIINPGEVGGWLTGKHTVAVLETSNLTAEIIDLDKINIK